VPDVAQAYEWYDRASKLGSAEALRHLARLDQARRSGSGPASPEQPIA
jgi:TPR repeat protein